MNLYATGTRNVVGEEMKLKGYGRVREVKFARDGLLFVLTNTPDAVLRILPVK